MKLIGIAFQTGRIDFTREDNPWAFSRIDAGMKQSQKDRILVDPKQAPVVLKSADVNNGVAPVWMAEAEQLLRSADSMYLQYKNGVLRFRRANHDAGSNRQFVTLGNQDEFDLYAEEHWKRIRYMYALRRPSAFCFDVGTVVTHKSTSNDPTTRVELVTRLDLTDPSGHPMISFDSTGYLATVQIVEWRGTVKEGEVGRYAPENCHVELTVKQVHRPFTFLHEDRQEFHNHSYTFSGDKTRDQLRRLIKKRLAERELPTTDKDATVSANEKSKVNKMSVDKTTANKATANPAANKENTSS